jgi:hypothetical protein
MKRRGRVWDPAGTEVTLDAFALAAAVAAHLRQAGVVTAIYLSLFIASAPLRDAVGAKDAEKELASARV